METPFFSEHWNDQNGNPAGGTSWGPGFAISWQNGPLGRCTCAIPTTDYPDMLLSGHGANCGRSDPNGAFVETIIKAALDRIGFYQRSRFGCDENERAELCLLEALEILNSRTARREAALTEGTHSGT